MTEWTKWNCLSTYMQKPKDDLQGNYRWSSGYTIFCSSIECMRIIMIHGIWNMPVQNVRKHKFQKIWVVIILTHSIALRLASYTHTYSKYFFPSPHIHTAHTHTRISQSPLTHSALIHIHFHSLSFQTVLQFFLTRFIQILFLFLFLFLLLLFTHTHTYISSKKASEYCTLKWTNQ